MLRVGIHYVEPRRIGYFLVEEALVWLGCYVAAAAAARMAGLTPPVGTLIALTLFAGLAVETALSLGELHDLRIALADATTGRRLLRLLGTVLLLGAAALAVGPWRGAVSLVGGAGLLAACLAVLVARSVLPAVERRLGLATRVFLVGEGAAAHRLVREIVKGGQIEVVGFCGPRALAIAEKAEAVEAHLVVLAVDDRRGIPTDELMRCRVRGLEVVEGGIFAARALYRLPVELVKPADLIFGDGFARPLWQRLLHRTISVTGALLLLLLTSPLLALAIFAIKRDSPGAALFRQTRIGKGGEQFEILKLRTMALDAEPGGAAWAQSDDPRVTRIGRLLRRYRVDELPQLINVLRGEMELIGPRPERPEFVALLRERLPFYDLRHLVAPGITGWAQVSYPYAASVEEAREKLQYDLYFVRHLSLSLDLLILLMTAKTVLLGRGAR